MPGLAHRSEGRLERSTAAQAEAAQGLLSCANVQEGARGWARGAVRTAAPQAVAELWRALGKRVLQAGGAPPAGAQAPARRTRSKSAATP